MLTNKQKQSHTQSQHTHTQSQTHTHAVTYKVIFEGVTTKDKHLSAVEEGLVVLAPKMTQAHAHTSHKAHITHTSIHTLSHTNTQSHKVIVKKCDHNSNQTLD